MPIVPHLTGMLSLCLYYAPATDESKQITDRSVNLIATHCVALREVQIHNNVNITDESVGAVLLSCNQLAVSEEKSEIDEETKRLGKDKKGQEGNRDNGSRRRGKGRKRKRDEMVWMR